MYDVKSVRNQFPFFKHYNDKLIYFDNACMSLRPQAVIDAVTGYYTEYPACAGRSNHRLARRVNEAVEESRHTLAKFINAGKPEEIVFVRNTSEGLNLVAHSYPLKAGDVVLTTDKEHNSNLVPWQQRAERDGIIHRVIPSSETNQFDLKQYEQLLTPEVKIVAVVMTANLDGVTNPIKEIAALAHRNGAIVVVDAAQSIPHRRIDVQALGVDFLAFSGHKMTGPSGIGVLYGKYELLDRLPGFLVGGDTVTGTTYEGYELLPPPEKFEAGLQNYAGIIGLKASVDTLTAIGLDEIHHHEVELNGIITAGCQEIENLHLIGPAEPELRGGVFSFYIDGIDSHQLALMLDESNGIQIRSGQHCVHSWFNAHKIYGSARASLYLYNTKDEAEKLVTALKQVTAVLKD